MKTLRIFIVLDIFIYVMYNVSINQIITEREIYMKKIICAILSVVFSLLSVVSFASVTSHNAQGADLSISLPDSMYVFDRNVSPSDTRITSLGLTYEGLMSSFLSQDIYLDALDTEAFNEIVVISEPTDDKNFFDLTADGLYNAVINEENLLTQSGRTIENSDLFEAGGVDFVKTVSKSKDVFVQYTTVYNGKKVKIRLIDFDGNLTDDEAEGFEEIVETVSFNTEPQKEKKETPPIIATNQPTSDVSADIKEPSEKDALYNSIKKIFIVLLVAVAVCTIPALIFRYVFTSDGIKKAGAKAFTFFYTIAMTALFYFIITKHAELKLSILICLVPVLWSFVIYKIVKR